MNSIISDLDTWSVYLLDQGKSKHTVRAYTTRMRMFATWFVGTNGEELTPDATTPTDLREYKAHMQTVLQQKARTVNLALNAISSWLKYHDEVMACPSKVKIQKPTPKWLSRIEKKAFIRTVEKSRNARDRALVIFMFGTGLRAEEIEILQISDLTINERSGSVFVRLGKGNKERTVPLNSDVRNALNDNLNGRTSGPVFMSQRGGKGLTTSGVAQIIDKYANQSNLRDVSPHTLRHTFGKELYDTIHDLVIVGNLLGHESLDVTKIYTTPSGQDLQSAVERISIS